jgi:hypothetical protein
MAPSFTALAPITATNKAASTTLDFTLGADTSHIINPLNLPNLPVLLLLKRSGSISAAAPSEMFQVLANPSALGRALRLRADD